MYDSIFFLELCPSESLYLFTIYLIIFEVNTLIELINYIELRNLYSFAFMELDEWLE